MATRTLSANARHFFPAFKEFLRNGLAGVTEGPEYFAEYMASAVEAGQIRHEFVRVIAIGTEGLVCEFKADNVRRAVKVCREGHAKNSRPEASFRWGYAVTRNLNQANLIIPLENPYSRRVADGSRSKKIEDIVAYRMVYGECNIEEALCHEIAAAMSRDDEQQEVPRIAGVCKSHIGDILSGLVYLHGEGVYHCDIKEENIIHVIDASGRSRAAITDFGCARRLENGSLSPASNGGFGTDTHRSPYCDLSKDDIAHELLVRNDLFGVSMILHRFLFLMRKNFGENVRSYREVRELYILAVLIGGFETVARCGQHQDIFSKDALVTLTSDFCTAFGPRDASGALELLQTSAERIVYSTRLPELVGNRSPKIMAGIDEHAPFSTRVKAITSHPAFRRLKHERQLGWLHQVFPLASHDRWAHALGVFDLVRRIYLSLLHDRHNPLAVICIRPEDIANAMVAALIHDIGQTEFAHTIEEYEKALYDHEAGVTTLLEEQFGDGDTLRAVILRDWSKSGVRMDRLLFIAGVTKEEPKGEPRFLAVDTLAKDIVSGMIDADRLDYLRRDSHFTNVPYGASVDLNRLLSSLSIAIPSQSTNQIRLSYHAKGLSAIESLLWARYQMFNSVYWHPTYRSIQTMFASALKDRSQTLNDSRRRTFFYQYVVLRKSVEHALSVLTHDLVDATDFRNMFLRILEVTDDRALHFAYVSGNKVAQEMVLRLASRELYKVVFERKVRDHNDRRNIVRQAIPRVLLPEHRVTLGEKLASTFFKALEAKYNAKQAKSNSETIAHSRMSSSTIHRILVDFPTRANITKDERYPFEISNTARKHGSLETVAVKNNQVFQDIGKFMFESCCLRVFAEPEMHFLINKYLSEAEISELVESVLPKTIFQGTS